MRPTVSVNTSLLAAVAFSLLAAMFLAISISRLAYPYDAGHYEACIWTPALLTVSGENPFAQATEPPFVMAPYGYLYYAIIGGGLKAFGEQLWFGRLLSIIATLVCLACIANISMGLTRNLQAAALALIAFLALFPLQAWIAIQRPDLPALALAFTALALVVKGSLPDKITARSGLAVLLLVSAFFFKQTILLPVIFAVAFYLKRGQRRLALYTLAGSLLLGTLAAFILNLTSAGGYFWQHFTLAGQIPYSYSSSLKVIIDVLKAPSTIICLAIIAPGWRSPRRLIYLYLAAAMLLGFITSARSGSNINHYLEATIVASIAVAIAWDSFTKERSTRRTLYILLISLLTLAGSFQMARIARGEYFRWQSLPYYREIVRTSEEHTSKDAIFISVYPELARAAGREFHFGDWIQYVDGRSPELQRVFEQALASGKYAAIIWSSANIDDAFPQYRLVEMKEPVPARFYPVYLFVLDER